MERTFRTVDGNEVVVHTKAVALRIAVREQPSLQHLVGRETYALNYVHGIEGGLLDFGIEVLGIAVKLEDSDIAQGEVLVIPHLGEVKRIDAVMLGLVLGHQLHLQFPARELAALDSLEQIALMRLAVFGDDCLGLLVGEVLDALQGAEMELNPCALIILVDEAVSVAAEAVHVAERGRNTARRHGDCDLMERLGQQCPEIPVAGGTAHAAAWVALDGVVEVGEFQGVTQEKHGSVVADQVPVSAVSIEFYGEATYVAFGIGGSPLAGHSREANQAGRLLANFREDCRFGEFRDVVGHGKSAERARTFGVHAPLGYHLAVEMGYFLNVPGILNGNGSRATGGLNILVVCDGATIVGGQSFLIHKKRKSVFN